MVSNKDNVKAIEDILDNEFTNGFQRGMIIAFCCIGANCSKCELAEECCNHEAGSEDCIEFLTESYK